MKFSLFTFEFTPEELKSLDLENYAKQALIDGIKEPKDEPEIISKSGSANLDTDNLLLDKSQTGTDSDFGEHIAQKINNYANDIITNPINNSKSCFADLFNLSNKDADEYYDKLIKDLIDAAHDALENHYPSERHNEKQ